MSGKVTVLLKTMYEKKWAYVALLPTFLFLFVFMLYPSYQAIIKSFYDWRLRNYDDPTFIGLANYIDLFSSSVFWKSMFLLVIFTSFAILVLIIINIPVAYLVYKLGPGKFGRFFQKAYIIPYMVPMIVIILYWRFFYDPNFGILNEILSWFGFTVNELPVWLGDELTALPALLFVNFPFIAPFNFIILYAGFLSIDESIHESAELDGASSWQQLLKIDIPMIVPQIKLLVILTIITGMQMFHIPMIFTDGGPNYSTMVAGLWMYKQGIEYGQLGYGSAIGVILFIFVLILTILTNERLTKKT